MSAPLRIVALISGRGSNLRAIIDEINAGRLPVELRAVISNNPNAPGLQHAVTANIPTRVIDHRDFPSRAQFDDALMQAIDAHQPQLVALAGFMRILGEPFITHYAGRLLNIHPSLLPNFPGLNTHTRAIESGAKFHGASAHFVTHAVDTGPVIIQAKVSVLPQDTPESLAARVLEQEHRIYPLALRWFAEDRLTIDGNRVLLNGAQRSEQELN